MPLIVLYFLYIASVLSFYIDVVLILSICCGIAVYVVSVEYCRVDNKNNSKLVVCDSPARFI